MKKFVSMMVALVMCISMLSMPASAGWLDPWPTEEEVRTLAYRDTIDKSELDALASKYQPDDFWNICETAIADDMIAKTTVPCTGCHYCASKCPKKLDIPFLLKLYNEAMVAGAGDFIAPMALASIDADKQPECCINCHSCEKVCPQTIHIPEELKKFAVKMGR